MNLTELRDPADARQFLTQSLWWQRVLPVRAEHVTAILDTTLAIASEGHPLPPLGFIADIGHMIFHPATGAISEVAPVPGVPAPLVRIYEDYVVGKFLADTAFERAGDALRQYLGLDRARGWAYLVNQIRDRANFPGVMLSPGTIKALRDLPQDEVLAEGWQSNAEHGPMPLLADLYAALIGTIRNLATVVGPEDIFELERRTALVQFGQRVALRQVLNAAKTLEESLPHHKPRSSGRRYEVPTRLLEEDTYPVGGFSSIATRGSIESLLHSQLAFMETTDRPDLFDIKFLRDELLFYARDENQFLRRRRTFIFALFPDLVQARFKDAELPYQRIILLLALLFAAVHRLLDWLGTDALLFEFVFVQVKDAAELAAEKEMFEVLLSEQIANRTVTIATIPAAELAQRCIVQSRRSQCHCLLAGSEERALEAESCTVSRLVIDGPAPSLFLAEDTLTSCDAESAALAWADTLNRLMSHWI